MRRYQLVIVIISFLSNQSFAQSGSLDGSFGIQGELIISLGNIGDQVNSVAIQSDQKIVLGGYTRSSFTSSDFALVRSNIDGTLDESFGIGGKVITPIKLRSIGNSVAIQKDGKILLGGSSDWFINLARFTSDGKLDSTFGMGGKVITDVPGYYSETCKSVTILADGKILVGGYAQHDSNDKSYFMLVRYNEDGVLDTSFGIGGVVMGGVGEGNSMGIQSDGKILLGGSSEFNFALARYNVDGTLDTNFGTAGEVVTTIGLSGGGNSIGIQKDGKIVMCGYGNENGTNGFALVRYNINGSLDTDFGINGKVVTDIGNGSAKGNSIAFQTDDKILVGGNAVEDSNNSAFAVVRYTMNGALDNSFGISGKLITPIGASYSIGNSLSIQSDGKIILGGFSFNEVKTEMALVRYNNDLNTSVDVVPYLSAMSINPNPFNSFTTIHFNTILQNAELNIFDFQGVEVVHIGNISGNEIQLNRNNLACGLYLLQIIDDHKNVWVENLLVGED